MLAVIGLLIVIVVVALLLSGRASPIVALVLVPLIGALVAGYGPAEISDFFETGIGRVMQVATMFAFAIVFFGVLQDTGLFRPIIEGLIKVTGGNVVYVAMGTALIGVFAHLDGAGATTFLLTVPALLPLYTRLGMSRYLMLLLLATGAGMANMLPWAGPLGRAAAVTGLDVTELWRPLIPVQLAGVVVLLAIAFVYGRREQRRIAAAGSPVAAIAQADGISVEAASKVQAEMGVERTGKQVSDEEAPLLRPNLLWVNAGLFLAVLAALVSGVLPAAYVFMIGLGVIMVVNYPDVTTQMDRIRAHAGAALQMSAIILAAGSFLGIVDGSGMLRAMAEALVSVLPEGAVGVLHLLLGLVALPIELILSTDAYYFGLLPVVLQITEPAGVGAAETVHALVIGNIIGTFISPFSPAMWLALGLARAEIGRHIRYSILLMWGYSLVLMGVGFLLGLY
ncbi:CitMHS family transporter [Maritimibacter alkaliphilus]|uniref:CitMHS family transporter n=1 Tax=Maritimibacter alkaliphilus TaxID=404236 RepID=UPI001C94DACE|nr:citrate:proton symporter [Maritimibacter alkaliphilus]MBY6092694.1 citrate:proton symporter [Maritimibacter alkaliphilus]